MLGRSLQVAAVLICACAVVCAGPSGFWLDVPFVKQEKHGCGAASIAMVMQFWQHQESLPPNADSDAGLIQRSLYSTDAQGIYASALEAYFQDRGYQTFAFVGREDDLLQHLTKGRPLIVALKPARGAPLHYVVVVGLDSENHLVLLNDPAERKLIKLEIAGFQKEWKGAGHWTLLAVPRSKAASVAP